jgi:hypothetical protein
MRVNRKGVTRIVFVFENVVVKIPNFLGKWEHFLYGLIGNVNEKKTWRYNSGKFEKGTSHLLCPVSWCSWGGWVLVMKKAKTLTEREWEEMPYFADEHRKHFLGDDTISNYGIFEGRLVKIDYGELDRYWGEDFAPAK